MDIEHNRPMGHAEVWLRPNRRVLAMSMFPAAAIVGVGLLLLNGSTTSIVRIAAWLLIILGGVLVVGLLSQWRRPRIAYRDGEVLFHLRAGRPIAVPVQVVEAFFAGQGPSHLPAVAGNASETVNLVARLSQKAPEWAHMEVKEALARWCDGYVSIRGTWCEPLSGELIRRLNHRLREIHLEQKAAEPSATTGSEAPA
jgi:hypothetical protein